MTMKLARYQHHKEANKLKKGARNKRNTSETWTITSQAQDETKTSRTATTQQDNSEKRLQKEHSLSSAAVCRGRGERDNNQHRVEQVKKEEGPMGGLAEHHLPWYTRERRNTWPTRTTMLHPFLLRGKRKRVINYSIIRSCHTLNILKGILQSML